MPPCIPSADSEARELLCRNSTAAGQLKLISLAIIFTTSIIGISSPVLLAKTFQGKPLYDKATLVIKCFAAGVILSTSLVHVLPDAFNALNDCVVSSHHPWKDFPFAGLVTLCGALLALLVDLTATSHAHGCESEVTKGYARLEKCTKSGNDHEDESGSYCGESEKVVHKVEVEVLEVDDDEEEEIRVKMRQRLVSQVLEIGIIFHSVIIGVTMGMSQNVCTIRPLVAALAFHQVFEGMGLGGCIAQAGFSFRTTAYMCFMFSVTTPVGIVLGMIVFSITGYDDSSAGALILEGLLGSLSSGILIYMALVDLIAADFFHNKMMSSEAKMKKACYVALVLGSASMSILALWA